MGIQLKVKESRVIIERVAAESAAYHGGLNAGDELLAINQQRIDFNEPNKLLEALQEGHGYECLVARQGYVQTVQITATAMPRKLKRLRVDDESLVRRMLGIAEE